MKKSWWKILSFVLLIYTVVAGFLIKVPDLPIIHQSIRNLYFHVCMWFAMMILFIISFIYSIKYLRNSNYRNDIYARHFAAVGAFIGILGYVTGAIWANYTWLTDQNQSLGSVLKEPKLLGAAIALLIYGAYFVLRGSFTDIDKRARVSAVYNIFAFAMLFPNTELMLMFFPIPIKAKYFVPIYVAMELFLGVQNFAFDNVAHFAHLGGALFGFILVKIWQRNKSNFY